ncbi:2-amino-3-ketobutyrate coenzyme A ligase, mitochondrial [Armadillidium vulgare]|nr:2-amino-3-ketobutyrate coenzyme A ligase, mitochondrial [Armadillidium vulgare]
MIYLITTHLLGLRAIGNYGIRVSDSLPAGVTEQCFIAEFKLAKSNFFSACHALCLKTESCLLACVKGFSFTTGNVCRLYSVNVSKYWPGATEPLYKLLGSKCYSVWADERDIAHKANYTSTTLAKDQKASNAADGFACYKNDVEYVAITTYSIEVDAWIMADFGVQRSVEVIYLQARKVGKKKTRIEYLEIRLGNSDDFDNNTLWYYFGGPPTPPGKIQVIRGNRTLSGRYFSIRNKDPNDEHLAMMEMKIIPV